MVLSRVLSIDSAPRNAFSFTFARVLPALLELRPGLDLILTYVNPNLGFTGASYLAANWTLFAKEQTHYAYLDGAHITMRELSRRFGGTEYAALCRQLGSRLSLSVQPLSPLLIFAYPTSSRATAAL